MAKWHKPTIPENIWRFENLQKPHREVIEGLIRKYFYEGQKGLLETLVGYLENIRMQYKDAIGDRHA